MKKLQTGTGWVIGGIIGLAYMVLIFVFERDLLAPIGIGGGVVSAWSIGFALESIHKKPLISKK